MLQNKMVGNTFECGYFNGLFLDRKPQSREVAYNMRMHNPVGPKTCQVKETQFLRRESVSGKVRDCF